MQMHRKSLYLFDVDLSNPFFLQRNNEMNLWLLYTVYSILAFFSCIQVTKKQNGDAQQTLTNADCKMKAPNIA